jgi:hypothetical protein
MSEPVTCYRVKKSYPKPKGGFLSVGPRYAGELLEGDPPRVRFVHHGDATWVEIVALEFLEPAPDPPKQRYRRA